MSDDHYRISKRTLVTTGIYAFIGIMYAWIAFVLAYLTACATMAVRGWVAR